MLREGYLANHQIQNQNPRQRRAQRMEKLIGKTYPVIPIGIPALTGRLLPEPRRQRRVMSLGSKQLVWQIQTSAVRHRSPDFISTGLAQTDTRFRLQLGKL